MAKKRTQKESSVAPRLDNCLLLSKYMLSLFGVESFEELTADLKNPSLERWDEENVSLFARTLCNQLREGKGLITVDEVLKYDRNIYNYTTHINEKRQDKIRWKYFQWLELLLTEVYLDRYFSDSDALLYDINRYRKDYFLNNPDNYTIPFVDPVTADQLHKLSVWCATGAGKTLMMHVNMLQLRRYADKNGMDYNNTILITPKEGLSRQHLSELEASDIAAWPFSKDSGKMYDKQHILVTEVTKLSTKDGDQTVNVDFFEKNNLVFIDEGHRGAGGETWKPLRDKLSSNGFCFEYSATFGQSIAAESNKKKRDGLLREYGTATLIDYSYKYFYEDGYGKDFVTRNIKEIKDDGQEFLYMTGGLLGFYEQMRLFNDKRNELIPYYIEKPAAIFVGNTVKSSTAEISDIVRLVTFFQQFVNESDHATQCINSLLKGEDGLIDKDGFSIYKDSFDYLRSLRLSAGEVYEGMLSSIFNSGRGQKLYLYRIKGSDGEIGMKMGNGSWFGVVNVGDANSVTKACKDIAETRPWDFDNRSLFDTVNEPDSTINILIGAKKFTEGWSSWRVSTMCLLNVGQGDGSEIIQLFGRGVRLKGYNFSLKRTNKRKGEEHPDDEPEYISILETLNIFGMKADYMEEFSNIIKDEGVERPGHDFKDFELPLMPNIVDLEKKRLKYLQLKKGKSFIKDVPLIPLGIDSAIFEKPVIVDMYPTISTFSTLSTEENKGFKAVKHEEKLNSDILGIIDWTRLYIDITEYKRQRGFYNLTIKHDMLKKLASNPSWYILYIPESSLVWDDYYRIVKLWQNIITMLLQGYVDKFYSNHKAEWVNHNLEAVPLTNSLAGLSDDSKIKIHIKESLYAKFKETLDKIQRQLEDKTFSSNIRIGSGFEALYFSRHLYSPLMYYNGKQKNPKGEQMIEISPVALVDSEHDFIIDLTKYVAANEELLKGYDLYLLRNKSKTGIGFFVDAGFYPDFILWIVKGKHQYVTFIDPHGLGRAGGFAAPKVQLYNMLHNETEKEIGDKNLTLNSFILSPTRYGEVRRWGLAINSNATDTEIHEMFTAHHIYFMKEDTGYVGKMLKGILK